MMAKDRLLLMVRKNNLFLDYCEISFFYWSNTSLTCCGIRTRVSRVDCQCTVIILTNAYLAAFIQERVPDSEEHFCWYVVYKYGKEPVKCEK